jgi:hypothetical protein
MIISNVLRFFIAFLLMAVSVAGAFGLLLLAQILFAINVALGVIVILTLVSLLCFVDKKLIDKLLGK